MASISPPQGHRSPLTDTTNSSADSISPTGTTFNPLKLSQPHHLRRKLSYRTFRPPTSSLDESASEHVIRSVSLHFPPADSLNQERGVSPQERGADISLPSPESEFFGVDAVLPQTPEESEKSPFRGRRNWQGASPLETIIEQKSISTLRKSKSFSHTIFLDGNCSSSSSNNAFMSMSMGNDILFPSPIDLFPSVDEAVVLEAGCAAERDALVGQKILPEAAGSATSLADPPQLCESPSGLPTEERREDSAVSGSSAQIRHSVLKAPRNYFPIPTGDMSNAVSSPFPELNMEQFRAASDPISNASHYRLPMGGYTPLNVHPFHRSPPAVNFTRPAPRARTAQAALQAVASKGQSPTEALKSKPRHVRFTSSVKGGQGSENSIEVLIEEPDPSPLEIVHTTGVLACQHLKRRKPRPREGLAGRNGQIASESESSGDSGQLVAPEPSDWCWRCACKRAWQTFCFICCGDAHDDHLPPNIRRPSSPAQFVLAA
ncbi:MAG: hypothetical protein M1829_004201 [Trizodia sp. TS-e1964]|nr:MAG: hypothetical protein M1829_004201 [Trizodia sp. TS-e1964]